MKPLIHIVFCDDIRHEVRGTSSLIGVMSGDTVSFVSPGPLRMPRLVVVAFITWDAENPLSNCSLEVYSGNDKVIDFPIPPKSDSLHRSKMNSRLVNAMVSVEISPLVAPAGHALKAYIRTGKRRNMIAILVFEELSAQDFAHTPATLVRTVD